MNCHGNGADHCCYLGPYGVCEYLEVGTMPDRHWVCGIMRRRGSWAKVYRDPNYKNNVKPKLEALGLPSCGNWPQHSASVMAQPVGLCCWQPLDTPSSNPPVHNA